MTTLLHRQLLDWRKLACLSNEQLGRYDIAAINLACAEGLPGADEIDHDYCLNKLDGWAEAVRDYTVQLLPQFRRKPLEYENSEAYFRALTLVTVLQRDLGVRYNPAKIPENATFDTADAFIHGVIRDNTGTCATLPVVYAAVGRRLGYPIKLVTTRGKQSGHLFARWDDAMTGERFNIEGAGLGLATPTDNHYRTGRYKMPPGVEYDGQYLVSATPRMELAIFLNDRAWLWEDLEDWRQCVDSWAWATSLVPQNKIVENSLRRSMNEWDREQEQQRPLGFPELIVRASHRQFPNTLPLELEQKICGMTAVHNMLTDPRLEEKYWRRMRQGNFTRTPIMALADFAEDTSCQIHLRIE